MQTNIISNFLYRVNIDRMQPHQKTIGVVLRLQLFLFLCVTSILMHGCATNAFNDPPKDTNRSIAFGYFEFEFEQYDNVLKKSEMLPGSIEIVYFFKQSKSSEFPKQSILNKERGSIFFLTNLSPGNYKVMSIDVSKEGAKKFKIVGLGNLKTLSISSPGVYYFGSYRISSKSDGLKIQEIVEVSEKELIDELLKKSKNSRWEEMIKARISAIDNMKSKLQ